MLGLLVRLTLTGALVALVVARVGVGEALDRVLTLAPSVSLGGVALYLASLGGFAVKLKVLLPECRLAILLRVTLMAQFYNLVLMGQVGGEVAKTVYLARDHQDVPRVIASTLFDRATGLVGLLILTLIGLGVEAGRCDPRLGLCVAVLSGGLLLGLVVLALPVRLPLPGRWLGRLGPTVEALRAYARRPAIALPSVLLGLAVQMVIVANAAWLGAGVGIQLPLMAWAVVIGVVSVVLLIPSVAGIGPRDVSLVGLLASFGIPPDAALALSMTLLGLQLVGAALGWAASLLPRPVPVAAA